jgi:Arc/MetJ-type ribon-helix-helix transcriptional regulator
MPELRVTVTEKMDKLISEIVEETGLFASKADLVRFATIAYIKELGWIKKPKRER